MEQTLGKRISAQRKQLGMPQDQLAEKLGVTAQAVSKWENDQSCPDITMLPKLAEIFGITTDALLGLSQEPSEPCVQGYVEETAEAADPGITVHYGSSRRQGLGFALWVIACGGLYFAATFLNWDLGLWDILWMSGLVFFGIMGLYPHFSFLRLGCAALGICLLLSRLEVFPFSMLKKYLLPALLLLLGAKLLYDSLRKPGKAHFSVHMANDCSHKEYFSSNYIPHGNSFSYRSRFGEHRQDVLLSQLQSGSIRTGFGEFSLDMTGVGEFLPGCNVAVSHSFGELELVLPRSCRAVLIPHTTFGEVLTKGKPDPDASQSLTLELGVNFGEVTVRYL